MTHQHASTAIDAAQGSDMAARRAQIYVACLAAYNSGVLHGTWIETTCPDEIREDVRAMLAASPVPGAEEWAIHDYEGFQGASLSEYASFETVCELADFIEERGELGAKLYDYFGRCLEDAKRALEDYAGCFRSLGEFAETLYEDSGFVVPKALQFYIDWNAMGRDMELSGEIITIQIGLDETHVFWSF